MEYPTPPPVVSFEQLLKEIQEIDEIMLSFNPTVIPNSWYHCVLYTTSTGKQITYRAALDVLSDIVYWYRPTEIRDSETGKVTGYKQKFWGDKLQHSYAYFMRKFRLEKHQVKAIIDFLRNGGFITTEWRTTHDKEGRPFNNVLFLSPLPEKIREITYSMEEVWEKRTQGKERPSTQTDHTSPSHVQISITPPPEIQTGGSRNPDRGVRESGGQIHRLPREYTKNPKKAESAYASQKAEDGNRPVQKPTDTAVSREPQPLPSPSVPAKSLPSSVQPGSEMKPTGLSLTALFESERAKVRAERRLTVAAPAPTEEPEVQPVQEQEAPKPPTSVIHGGPVEIPAEPENIFCEAGKTEAEPDPVIKSLGITLAALLAIAKASGDQARHNEYWSLVYGAKEKGIDPQEVVAVLEQLRRGELSTYEIRQKWKLTNKQPGPQQIGLLVEQFIGGLSGGSNGSGTDGNMSEMREQGPNGAACPLPP